MKLDYHRDVLRFLDDLDAKRYRQVGRKILSLVSDPAPADSKPLAGHAPYLRVDIGEYRIVYKVVADTFYVDFVGKRNDDEEYRVVRRRLG